MKQLNFLCSCGCGEEIEIKKHHKRAGMPQYKHGHNRRGKSRSEETKRKISEAQKGKSLSEEHLKNWRESVGDKFGGREKGFERSEETKKKLSKASRELWQKESFKEKMTGNKSHAWKGGRTEFSELIRNCEKYKKWRKQVYEKDDYTCQKCGEKKSGELNADHIIPLSKILSDMLKLVEPITKGGAFEVAMKWEPLWSIENGRTLCFDCHKQTDTYSGKTKVANIKRLI